MYHHLELIIAFFYLILPLTKACVRHRHSAVIKVGENSSHPSFEPDSILMDSGDTLYFHFYRDYSTTYGIAQSRFEEPCVYDRNNGVSSGNITIPEGLTMLVSGMT